MQHSVYHYHRSAYGKNWYRTLIGWLLARQTIDEDEIDSHCCLSRNFDMSLLRVIENNQVVD